MMYKSFRYELRVPGGNQLMGFPLNNGTWTGVIGQLISGVSATYNVA